MPPEEGLWWPRSPENAQVHSKVKVSAGHTCRHPPEARGRLLRTWSRVCCGHMEWPSLRLGHTDVCTPSEGRRQAGKISLRGRRWEAKHPGVGRVRGRRKDTQGTESGLKC